MKAWKFITEMTENAVPVVLALENPVSLTT